MHSYPLCGSHFWQLLYSIISLLAMGSKEYIWQQSTSRICRSQFEGVKNIFTRQEGEKSVGFVTVKRATACATHKIF